MTQGVDEGSFDGAAFIGYHAGAGHPTGTIAHTYSSVTIMEIRVNGAAHNEAGLNAIRLGHHGVPVILVAGDDALASEVETLLPWAERVIVKRGLGTNLADSLSPAAARDAIRDGMARALARMGEMSLYRPSTPLRWRDRLQRCRSWPTTRACCRDPSASAPERSASRPRTATRCTGPASSSPGWPPSPPPETPDRWTRQSGDDSAT